MNASLISVVMTVYNAERYVAEAIGSIAAQTLRDFECIVVDDGSTDRSLAAIKRCAAVDKRIRIISRPNTGIVGALNDGLSAASGEFIARMDADDLCDPNRFELQVCRLRAQPDLVALGSSAMAIDPHGRRLGIAPVPLTHDEIECQHLQGVSSMYHPAVMMRRDAVEQVGRYRDFCPAEDYDLWLRLGEIGCLANLPDPLLIWRRTLNGLVARSLNRQRRMVTAALAEAWKRRRLPDAPTICANEIQSTRDLFKQWAWMALRARERTTCRYYALKALIHDPCSLDSWRLAACALRGH